MTTGLNYGDLYRMSPNALLIYEEWLARRKVPLRRLVEEIFCEEHQELQLRREREELNRRRAFIAEWRDCHPGQQYDFCFNTAEYH